jgi:hemerythrin-like metal-binding protein
MEEAPAYAKLMTVHFGFHKVACDYLNISLGDDDEQAKKRIETEFRMASADVVAAIDGLRDAVEADRGTSAYSSQFSAAATTDSVCWDQSLAIGIPALDEHHKAIIDILNKLMENPDAALHSESAVDSLTDLTRILDLHFSIEEAYMKRLGMPEQELAEHQKRHTEILEQCAQLNVASYANRDLKVRNIASQIHQWAIDHVIEYDFNIKNYLRTST